MTEASLRPGILPTLLLALLGGLVFLLPTLWYEPGGLDAVDALWRKIAEAGPLAIVSGPVEGIYAPLAGLSAYVDLAMSGALGWAKTAHLQSILIHVLAGIALLNLLVAAGLSRWVAWLGAALFLVHPAAHEATALIGLRTALWAGFLGFLALVGAVRGGRWQVVAVVSIVGAVAADWRAVLIPALGFFVAQVPREDGSNSRIFSRVALLTGVAAGVAAVCHWMQGTVPGFDLRGSADAIVGALWPRSPGFVFTGASRPEWGPWRWACSPSSLWF